MDHKLLNILLGTLPSPKSLRNNQSSGEDCEMSPKEEDKKPSIK